jgi:hypothetical protein
MKNKRLIGRLIFWALFALLFFVYAFQEILFFPSHSIHSWRQADCLSLAQNFMDTNSPFEPSIHNYISDNQTSGKSAGEFTGLYFLVGKIWNITGMNLAIYRGINLAIMIFSCFALYKALYDRWKDLFWSLFVSMLLFISPLCIFYTPNFLTDITALAFTIWGWAYFIRYLEDRRFKLLFWALGLIAVGALFKVTAGISFLALLGIFGFELIGLFKKENALFPKRLKTFLLFCGLILFIMSWYFYAEYFNSIHKGKYTFNDLWPLWELTPDHYKRALIFFHDVTIKQFFHPLIFWSLIPLTLSALVIAFKRNIRVFVFLMTVLFGTTLYIFFWFGALENHDYYFLNLMILPLMMIGLNVDQLIRSGISKKIELTIKIVSAAVFILGVFYSASNIRMRYCEKLTVGRPLARMFYDDDHLLFWTYTASMYLDRDLLTMEKYNRSIGMKKEDLVIVYPDFSFNIALFKLNQKGWSSFDNPEFKPEVVEAHIGHGAKYLIINRFELPDLPQLAPYMQDSIGTYNSYTVYKLR